MMPRLPRFTRIVFLGVGALLAGAILFAIFAPGSRRVDADRASSAAIPSIILGPTEASRDTLPSDIMREHVRTRADHWGDAASKAPPVPLGDADAEDPRSDTAREQNVPNSGKMKKSLPADGAPATSKAASPVAKPPSANGPASIAEISSDIKKNLEVIPAVYNTPKHLEFGKSASIAFILEAPGLGIAAEQIKQFPGPAKTAKVPVSTEVQALLSGPPDLVEIKPRGLADLQKKTITNLAPVQWTWDVKGVGEGKAVLQLELVAFVSRAGKTSSFQVRTFQEEIPIEITMRDRFVKFVTDLNPIWAFGATVVTGIAGVLAYFGWAPRRRDAESGDKPSRKRTKPAATERKTRRGSADPA